MILRFSTQSDSPHSQILRKTGQKKAEPNMPTMACGAAETHASKNSWCAAAHGPRAPIPSTTAPHRTAPRTSRPGRGRRRRAAHGQRPAGHSALCFQSRDGATATRRSWRSASSSMLYPADGERGQLVQSNPSSPRRPVLQWGS
jgi:hypothetical protein